jgi:pimeloyl-ACP methyl ester carboxylesterase
MKTTRSRDRQSAMPYGQLIDLGTHRLHLLCSGSGSPAVIFDAALGASSLSWSLVQPQVAEFTRACSYDRAGFGFSEAGPLPRTVSRIATELHELLRRTPVDPPYVLVGHSFGAFTMRVYTHSYPEDVAGLVLVDPAHPDEWIDVDPAEAQRLARGVTLCRQGARLARLGFARGLSMLVRSGALDAARACVGLVTRGRLRREDEQILAPINRLPRELQPLLHRIWTRPEFFDALGSQIEYVRESAAAVAGTGPFGDLPLAVVSAAGARERRARLHEAATRLSTRGRHIVVDNTGHWIPLDRPDAVTNVIREMVFNLRSGDRAIG